MKLFSLFKTKKATPVVEEPLKEQEIPQSKGSIWYKCRNCGDIFNPMSCTWSFAEFLPKYFISDNQYPPKNYTTSQITVYSQAPHHCTEDCWSIGDFLKITKIKSV